MCFTWHKIKFLAPSKSFLVKNFAFALKLLSCFECKVPCLWLHHSIRHRQGRSRNIMGQQIASSVQVCNCLFCSWLLWKQWRSRSSWSAEEVRRNISLGVLPGLPKRPWPCQSWAVLPVLPRAGQLRGLLWGSNLFLSVYHLLPLPSTGTLLQSAALLHVLALTRAMTLIGLSTGKLIWPLVCYKKKTNAIESTKVWLKQKRLAKDMSFSMYPAGLAEFIDFNGVIPAYLVEITAH